tara:strand:- start:170 stop:439 length:270 start_codon:yes stop_codon:yes gene_type:complete
MTDEFIMNGQDFEPTVSSPTCTALLYCLQLKESYSRHKYFTYMEPNPLTNIDYMEVGKWKDAKTFEGLEKAREFKGKNDKDNLFEIELV